MGLGVAWSLGWEWHGVVGVAQGEERSWPEVNTFSTSTE